MKNKNIKKSVPTSNRTVEEIKYFFEEIKYFWRYNKDIILIGFLFVTWAVCFVPLVHKENRVMKQVEAYKKTLPGYLEQQQKIEHYRDSLMNVNGR